MSSSGEYLSHIDLRNNHSPQLDSAGPTIDQISPYYGYVPSLPVTVILSPLYNFHQYVWLS